MENNISTEIYREQINQKIINVEYFEDGIAFVKEDRSKITLSYHHEQDCCEKVYADFEAIKGNEKEIIDKEFKEMVIKGIEDIGFIICFYKDWDRGEKVFVPCYNDQNGYYSSDLELIINGNLKTNISKFVEDCIDD